jgi:hypothetical protein
MILPSLPPEYWDYRHLLPFLVMYHFEYPLTVVELFPFLATMNNGSVIIHIEVLLCLPLTWVTVEFLGHMVILYITF